MHVLDCTLRDGGYYTNWEFDHDFVLKHLRAIHEAGVEYVEMGYRSIVSGNDYYGQYKYVSDSYLASLPELLGLKFAVMVDVKEFETLDQDIPTLVDSYFTQKEHTRLDMIRLALVKKNFDVGIEMAIALQKKGYDVTINLMQCMILSDDQIRACIEKMISAGISIFYIADSYGSMKPYDVDRLFSLTAQYPSLQVGLHLHNNTELAFANALQSLQYMPYLLDGSVLGIGRGAGNLALENLLVVLNEENNMQYDPTPVFQLATEAYAPMKEKYGWGSNIAYMLAGMNNIHQNYVYELLTTGRYMWLEIIHMINFIAKDTRSTSFNRDLLDDAIVHRFQDEKGAVSYQQSEQLQLILGDEVVILGRGESVYANTDAINQFVQIKNIPVFECNYIPGIMGDKDVCFSIKYSSFCDSLDGVLQTKKKSIIGFPQVHRNIVQKVNDIKPLFLPYKVEQGTLHCNVDEKIVIPHDVVSMYSIAYAIAQGVRRIYVAGFDGYRDQKDWMSQKMESEMIEFFALVRQYHPDVEIISITPTTYAIKRQSVYYLVGVEKGNV